MATVSQQGWSQQTAATRLMISKAMGTRSASKGTRKRKSSGKKKAARVTTKRKSKLKFGSPAYRKKYLSGTKRKAKKAK